MWGFAFYPRIAAKFAYLEMPFFPGSIYYLFSFSERLRGFEIPGCGPEQMT